MNKFCRVCVFAAVFFACTAVYAQQAAGSQNFPERSVQGRAQMPSGVTPVQLPAIDVQIRRAQTGQEVSFYVQLLLLLTVLTLAPSILLLVTCFLRFSIVLDFIKRALSLQQVPPTSVLNGIAFFLTLFVMWPTFTQIYNNSFKPLSDGQIPIERAFSEAEAPLRIFMYKQMAHDPSSVRMCMSIAKLEKPKTLSDIPTYVLIPSFILHELTIAFQIGIFLYLPFIIIDMIVASILMSMGMIMLPPIQISMPFKLILFVMVDGWSLLFGRLFESFL